MNFATGQTTPPPSRAAAAVHDPSKPGAEAGGVREAGGQPSPLVEVRPQGQVQQHTAEHSVDVSPFMQILDAPVPLMVEQLVDVLQFVDARFCLLPSR